MNRFQTFSFAAFLSLVLMCLPFYASAQSFIDGLEKLEAGQADQAVAIWTDLASQGNVESQYGLALVYETGAEGVDQDLAKSIEFYQLAASAGLPEAQTNLGLIYANGEGASKDTAKAAELWTQAAISNNAIAQFNLGLAYLSGQGVQADQAEGLGLVLVAAAQGLPDARFAMAQFYLRGLGLPEDFSLARYFFEEALAAGHPDAQAFIDDLNNNGIQAADIDVAVSEGRLPSLPKLLSSIQPQSPQRPAQPERSAQVTPDPAPQPTPEPQAPQRVPQPIPVQEPSAVEPAPLAPTQSDVVLRDAPDASAQTNPAPAPAPRPIQRPTPRPVPLPVPALEPAPAAPVSPLRTTNEVQAQPVSPLRLDAPLSAPSPSLTPAPVPAPTPRPQQQPSNATPPGFLESPEGMLVMQNQDLPGDVVVLWLGTMNSTAQGKEFWEFSLARAPEILDQVDAILQPIRVKGTQAFRVLAGPLPDKALAWKICNAIKAGAPTFFCKPLVL